MTTNLPEWISKASSIDNLRLRQALAIAWEALEYYKQAYDDKGFDEEAKYAMRRIEELGK